MILIHNARTGPLIRLCGLLELSIVLSFQLRTSFLKPSPTLPFVAILHIFCKVEVLSVHLR